MEEIDTGEWHYRIYRPVKKGRYPTIFLFHGLGGDTSSMDLFAGKFSTQATIISPRGLYPAPNGGYQWLISQNSTEIWVDDFSPAVEAFSEFLRKEDSCLENPKRIRMAGFSQGAAFVYSFALMKPNLVDCFAGLVGFMPLGAAALARNRPLIGKKVLIAHGKRDETIPIELAGKARDILDEAGATVVYCEDDVGHKLGADCFPGFATFMLNC